MIVTYAICLLMPPELFDYLSHFQSIVFISPHLDDAVFSAGGLLAHISRQMPTLVINVFTRPGHRSTLSAQAYLRQCGFTDPHSLYEARLREDTQVLATLSIRPVNLGFSEALWRSKPSVLGNLLPEISAVYPTYRWHISRGKVSVSDTELIHELRQSLVRHIPPHSAIFVPFGVGNHVDHILVRDTAASLFSRQIVCWADIPYSLTGSLPAPDFTYVFDQSEKINLINGYTSQVGAVFRSGLHSLPPEKYYLWK